jgi:hypothetical protein
VLFTIPQYVAWTTIRTLVMSQRHLFGFFVLFACCFLPEESNAFPTKTPVFVCNRCSNPTIVTALRENFPNYNTQHVLDFDGRRIRRFKQNGNHTWSEIPVEPREQEYFNIVLEFKDKNGGSLKYFDNIQMSVAYDSAHRVQIESSFSDGQYQPFASPPPVEGVSAWEVVDTGFARNEVKDHLNRTMGSRGFFQRFESSLHMAAGKVRILLGLDNPTDVRLGIRELAVGTRIDFQDASHAKFAWDPYSASWEYVPHSSHDSSNNIIPEKFDDISGGKNSQRVYNFPQTQQASIDALEFQRRITRWNVPIPNVIVPIQIVCTHGQSRTVCTRSR